MGINGAAAALAAMEDILGGGGVSSEIAQPASESITLTMALL